MSAHYHSRYERQDISRGQEADRGPRKADRVRCAGVERAEPPLARVQENVSGACRGGVPRSVAKVHTAADLKEIGGARSKASVEIPMRAWSVQRERRKPERGSS